MQHLVCFHLQSRVLVEQTQWSQTDIRPFKWSQQLSPSVCPPCLMFSVTLLKHYTRFISFCVISWINHRSEGKQSQLHSSVSLWQPLRGSSLTKLANMKGFIYAWLSQLYFNDLNGSLCAARGFALIGLQFGSDINDPRPLKDKAVKVCIRLRLCCTRWCPPWAWVTPNWTPRPSFKTQSSMFTLFFIRLTCSFIVHCPGTPSPVSNLPLDWYSILLQR